MMKDIKKVAIYNRISRDNNETDDVLLNHRIITTRFCESKGYDYKLYEEIESGGKYEERKVLLQLLNDLDDGLYDGLVVVELPRLARNNLYAQSIAEVLVKNEVPIITTTRNRPYNLDDESDRLMYDLESMLSSKELRTITRRMKAGKLERARRGEWVQGLPPFGYRRNDITKKLEIVESEAGIVRFIFNQAESGYGIATIVKQLAPYKTRNGKHFNISSVNKILSNRTYTGTITYTVRDKRGKISESIVSLDSHEPIIQLAQFNTVQTAIKGRISGNLASRNRSRGKCISILKDLLYCGECGLKMKIKRDSKRKERIYVNKCSCGNKGIMEDKLLPEFWDELATIEKQLRESFQKALKTPTTDSKEFLNDSIEKLNKRSQKAQAKLKRLRDAYTEGVFTKEEYFSDKGEVEKELDKINSSMNELSQNLKLLDTETIANEYETKLKWLADIRKLSDIYSGKLFVMGKDLKNAPLPKVEPKDIEEVNRLLKLVIDKVRYRRYNEETHLYEDGYTDTEYGDFIEVTISAK